MHHAYRTALVTGASGGIGERLARLMAGLIVVARAAGRLAGLADDLRDAHHVPAEVLAADLTTSAGCESLHAEVAGHGVPVYCPVPGPDQDRVPRRRT